MCIFAWGPSSRSQSIPVSAWREITEQMPDSAANVGHKRGVHGLQVPGCDAELTRETKVYCLQRHICKAHLEVWAAGIHTDRLYMSL